MKARSLILVPRLPSFPKRYTGNPFTSDGDVYAECGVEGCGYHTWGSRRTVKLAMDEHHRFSHSQETAVVLLNQRKH